MSPAELIRRLQALPAAPQAEVCDFVEFLASRQPAGLALAEHERPCPAANPPREPVWLDKPFVVPGFTPMSREEANARL